MGTAVRHVKAGEFDAAFALAACDEERAGIRWCQQQAIHKTQQEEQQKQKTHRQHQKAGDTGDQQASSSSSDDSDSDSATDSDSSDDGDDSAMTRLRKAFGANSAARTRFRTPRASAHRARSMAVVAG
jgi:hypothetical protein